MGCVSSFNTQKNVPRFSESEMEKTEVRVEEREGQADGVGGKGKLFIYIFLWKCNTVFCAILSVYS